MRILFCGLSGIPNRSSASINRYMAIAQAMSLENEIIFVNRFPIFRENLDTHTLSSMSVKVIDATKIQYRPESFFKRNYFKLTSFIYEFYLVKKLNKERKIDWLNVYTQFFCICLFYYFLSKLFGFKTIIHYVEFRSKIKGRNFLYRINDLFFDKYAIFLCDKLIPISDLINNHILDLKATASTFIIPPICDFNYFDSIDPEVSDKKYFVFCGSAIYDEIILFVIESFLKISNQNAVTLHLVINGNITSESIKELIKKNNKKILVFSDLDYAILIAKYKGSLAQLIPLRNSIQDCARFPQKICEYLASKRPIITNGFGEINHYFIDCQNAIIAKEFDRDCYSEKLEWTLKNPDKVEAICKNSYSIGRNFFDIKSYSSKLSLFLKEQNKLSSH